MGLLPLDTVTGHNTGVNMMSSALAMGTRTGGIMVGLVDFEDVVFLGNKGGAFEGGG